jgi:DNA recombination protein RmuC
MSDVVLVLGSRPVTALELGLAAGLALIALAIAALVMIARSGAAHRRAAELADAQAREMETRLAELTRIQAEMTGRMQSMAEVFGGRQADMAKTMSERLDAVTNRIGESMLSSTRHTLDSLRGLHERLAVIDTAQKNLTGLTQQVNSLTAILANKQSRGAFGQGRMEAILQDGLPPNAYAFQVTLSNGKRPDGAITLPGDPRPLIIDAKFPLEAVTAWRGAPTDDARKIAARDLRIHIGRHIDDIAEKYLIPGETQDLALLFVPSESVYADLHEGFDDLIQKSFRARVMIVSPSLMMLAIQVLQSIVKDHRMREAAHAIQAEVGHLSADLGRLRERVINLQKHFAQANDDVAQIIVSADKVTKRGARIEAMEFEDGPGRIDPRDLLSTPNVAAPKLSAGE